MHVKSVSFMPDRYPTRACHPFDLPVFQQTKTVALDTPITIFVGDNGTGKSTLLEAIARACGIHIWRDSGGRRVTKNPHADRLCDFVSVEWLGARVPGAFFASSVFEDFARVLDDWAADDPSQLDYWGGRSLVTQSHGQSTMAFFRARYRIEGLYLLDEPETALAPKAQLELLEIIVTMARAGHAQFILATHSPILLACPGAAIQSFDHVPVRRIEYEQTAHYQLYKSFFEKRHELLRDLGAPGTTAD
jgi:predicted ATPase